MTVPASDLAEVVRTSLVIACAEALRGDKAAMEATIARFCDSLDKLIATVRTEARDDLLHGPAGSRRWNVTPREDGGMDVCRGDHDRGAGCAHETFRPEKHTTDALGVQRVLYRSRSARVLALLRKIEWRGDPEEDWCVGWAVCPCCRGAAPDGDNRFIGKAEDWARFHNTTVGHAADCEIDAALKENA